MIENGPPLLTTVCCGGGVDSTALIYYYLQRNFQVRGIHFDYGQPSCASERKAVGKIANYFGINIFTSRIEPSLTHQLQEMLVGRNTILILSAINYFQQTTGLITLGIHSGTGYYDCTLSYVEKIQHILDGYLGGTLQLDCPFIDFTKLDVIAYSKTWGLPIHLTYSCTKTSGTPCGKCSSCLDRQQYGIS